MLYDAHTHLMSQAVLDQCFSEGLSTVICCATRPQQWEKLSQIHAEKKAVLPAFGIHPWYVENVQESDYEILDSLLTTIPESLLGEIGLDKNKENYDKQLQVFERQLFLTKNTPKAVQIHSVGAWNDIMPMLRKFPDNRYFFHRFNGSLQIMNQLNSFCSAYFGTIVPERLTDIPADKLLLESDSPDGLSFPWNVKDFVKKNALDTVTLSDNLRGYLNGNKTG